MRLYDQEVNTVPTVPSGDVRAMRVNSLAEEVGELAMASGMSLVLTASPGMTKPVVKVMHVRDFTSLEDIADALVDCQYFIDGTACAYGLDLEPLFNEVHSSNMRKLWTLEDLNHMQVDWAAKAVSVVDNQDGTYAPPPIQEDGNHPVRKVVRFIVKRPDGKVMKPPGYKPADLSHQIKLQSGEDRT